MNNILTKLFMVVMLMMFSMGASADIKVLYGEKGTEKFEGTGGTIEVKQEDSKDDKTKVTVTLIVTPSDGYTLARDNSLEVYAVISPEGATTRALEVSGDALKLDCNDFKDISQKRTYTVDIDSKLALWVKSANFEKKRDTKGTITITYHIINLGRLDDNGALTSTRTEALQFTSTSTTVRVPDKYKSPLAKNWKYYTSDEITETTINSKTTYTFAASTTLVEGTSTLSDGDHVYVTYELDKDKFREIGIYNRGIYKIKFPDNYYLKQTYWDDSGKIPKEINTGSATNPTTSEFLWKFNVIDPYQITVQSQSQSNDNCFDYYLCSKLNNNGVGNFGDIRLNATISGAKATDVWAFGLLNGRTSGTYQLVVTDGYTMTPDNNNKLDSFGHGYLNNKRSGRKTTYQLYNQSNYDQCDLSFIPVTQNYIIVNNSGEPLVQALSDDNTLDVPGEIKSPLASYTYYGTQQDAISEGTQLSSATGATIYVRYTTRDDVLNLKGEIKYNISVGGTNYLYAADETSLSSETTSENNANNNHKWILMGNDAYQITIKNVGNNNEITYSSGEVAPTLSSTGSKFFFHQSSSGNYEVVAITSNDYSTPDYYTLGMDAGNLKLYSNSSHVFGDGGVQTIFTPRPMATITELPTASTLSYNGSNQELVTAGTASNGTIKYRLGDTGSYETSIPTGKDVDTYNVYYMAEGADGYEDFIAADPVEVTINKQSITVSGITASDKIYDGNTTATLDCTNATLTGRVGSEDISITTAVGAFEDANVGTGKTVIISGLTLGGDDLGNYELATSGQQTETTANISAKAVTITANDASKDYDGTPLTATDFTATALETGDEHTFTVTMTSESTITNAGTQPNVIAMVDNVAVSTGEETPVGNYLVTTSNGLLTISRVAVTVTADNKTKGFGDADPELTWTASGLKGSDTEDVLTVSISRAEGEDVSVDPYTITPSGEVEQGNYEVTYNTGELTITAKAIAEGTDPADGITIEITKENDVYIPVVKQNGTAINFVTDYNLSTTGGPNTKYYEVTVTGANNYSGSFTVKYANFKSGKKDTSDNEEKWSGTFVSNSGDGDITIPSGMAAYIVTGVNGNAVEVEELDFIPEGVPILLLSDDFAYCFVVKAKVGEGTADTSSNLLEEASGTSEQRTKEAGAVYVVYNGEFVLNMPGVLNVGTVYLPNSLTEGPALARLAFLGNSFTGIESVSLEMNEQGTDEKWYSLDGRRLNDRPTKKGLYLMNRKKVVIK